MLFIGGFGIRSKADIYGHVKSNTPDQKSIFESEVAGICPVYVGAE